MRRQSYMKKIINLLFNLSNLFLLVIPLSAQQEIELRIFVKNKEYPYNAIGYALVEITGTGFESLQKETGTSTGRAIFQVPHFKTNKTIKVEITKTNFEKFKEELPWPSNELHFDLIPIKKSENKEESTLEPEYVELNGYVFDEITKRPLSGVKINFLNLDYTYTDYSSPETGSFIVNIEKEKLDVRGDKLNIFLTKPGYPNVCEEVLLTAQEKASKYKLLTFNMNMNVPSKWNLLFPGLHQLERGDNCLGWTLLGASTISVAFWTFGEMSFQSYADKQSNANNQEDADFFYEKSRTWKITSFLGLCGVILSYYFNIRDYKKWNKTLILGSNNMYSQQKFVIGFNPINSHSVKLCLNLQL